MMPCVPSTRDDVSWPVRTSRLTIRPATPADADATWAYRTEAVDALLAICFEQLGLRRVVAGCFADNEASWRLAERVGMRRESHKVRDSLHRERGWLDGFEYALLAEEWAARAS